MRTPLVIMVVLAAALLGLDAITSSGSSSKPPPPPRRATPVATIARRVEAIRHLRYRRLPVPERVSPAQARADGLADFDRSEPPRRRAGEEEVLELLGLARPGTSLRQVAASLYGEGVAGYYDPHSKRLKVVTGTATSTPVLAETVLAHELTHALEDQRFGLLGDERRVSSDDDASLAATALIEGSATEVMQRYSARWFSRSELLAGAIASAFAPTGDLPPFLESQTLFPYLGGQAFVEYLLRRAGGRWDLVDTADRLRPPASTEQVMHPAAYLRADEPLRVRLRPSLGRGWTRVLSGTWGELQTRDMLRLGGAPDATAAAAGWGGDPLGALALPAADRRLLRAAVPRRRRADHALALGHPARRARVRHRLARVGGQREAGRGDRRRSRRGDARAGAEPVPRPPRGGRRRLGSPARGR